MTARDIEVGDLVHLGFYGKDAIGVVATINVPPRRHVLDGFKTRAKILMNNGKSYNFVLEDLIIVSKGKQNESI